MKITVSIPDKDIGDLTEKLASYFEPRQTSLFKSPDPSNHYKPWTNRSRRILRDEINEFIHQLAKAKGRTENSIYWAIRRELSVPLWGTRE